MDIYASRVYGIIPWNNKSDVVDLFQISLLIIIDSSFWQQNSPAILMERADGPISERQIWIQMKHLEKINKEIDKDDEDLNLQR